MKNLRLVWLAILVGALLTSCRTGSDVAATPTPTPLASGAHEGEPEPGHGEHHEHPEGTVEISSEQAEVARLQVQVAGVRPIQRSVRTTGTVTGNPDLEMQVAARVTGVIEQLYAGVGDWVTADEAVAVMDSVEATQAQFNYHRDKIEYELAVSNLKRKLTLSRLGDTVRRPREEALKELAAARNSEQGASAVLALARAKTRRLELLRADGIASDQQFEEAVAARQEAEASLHQAQLDMRVAKTHMSREQRISNTGVLADTEAWEARAAEARAREALDHSREFLELMGAGVDENHDNLVTIRSRLAGLVTKRSAARGERVEAGQTLFTILDISRLWLWIDLYERDLSAVRQGMPVRIQVPAYPKRTFTGKISYLSPELNPESRTVRARVEILNRERLLKPNMFATVDILSGRSRPVLAIPVSSLSRVENQDVVYVQGEPDHFLRRAVRLGERDGGWVEITSGLKAGEKVATEGVFLLKSIDLKASTEEGHSH